MKSSLGIFIELVETNREVEVAGIYAVFMAHPDVLEVCVSAGKQEISKSVILC